MQMVSTKKAMVVLPLPERGTSCFMGVLPWPEGDFCDCTYVRVAGDSFCFCTRFTDPTLELAKHGWNDSRNLGGCQCERFCCRRNVRSSSLCKVESSALIGHG